MSQVPEAIDELRGLDQWVAYSHAKVPIGPTGFEARTNDASTWGSLADAKHIREVQRLPGVGFVFSRDDPYVGIDLDRCIDPETDRVLPWAQRVIDLFDSYTEFSPGGIGLHIWIRGAAPEPGARVTVANGGMIEAYRERRYFTVTGRHLAGTPTSIEDRGEALVAWWQETFRDREDQAPVQRQQTTIEWEAPETETWLGDALRHISADCSYDEWVRVGMAIKAELGDRGFDFWDTWSATGSTYPGQKKAWRKWGQLDPKKVSIATVVWLAEQGGYAMPRSTIKLPPGLEGGWQEWKEEQVAWQLGVQAMPKGGAGVALRWLDLAGQWEDQTEYEPDLVSPGVLGTGDIMLVFGPPKSMKSMVLVDMFRAWALGDAWHGLAPARQLRTAYLQFELKADKMRQRLHMAPMTPEQLERIRGWFVYTDRFTPQLGGAFVEEMAASLRGLAGPVDVLVVDPIANIYTGQSENDNAQMSEFLRHLKVMRNAVNPDAAMVLVHHAGKMGRDDRRAEPFNSFRGASSLRGTYDTGVCVEPEGDGRVQLSWELRNGPGLAPMQLQLEAGQFMRRQIATDGGEQAGLFSDDIVQLLRIEAAAGRYYTSRTFSEAFSDRLGAARGIRSRVQRLADEVLVCFHRGPLGELPQVGERSHGYLVVQGAGIDPTHRRHAGELVQWDGLWG